MIENRFRLEREILRGRQAVRRSAQTKERVSPSDDVSSFDPGNLPDTSKGAPVSPVSAQDDNQGEAWPDDTDTDMPFRFDARDGKLRLRHAPKDLNLSGTVTPANMKSSQDPLRSPALRRAWTSQLLGESEAGSSQSRQDYGFGTPDPIPTSTASHSGGFLHMPHLRTGGLLKKLRPKSFPNFPSPFQSFRKLNMQSNAASEQGANDAWSSDSTDLEDDLNDGVYEPFGLIAGDDDDLRPVAMTSSQELYVLLCYVPHSD